MSNYNKAYVEVSAILSYLDKSEYDKIPANIIEKIEKNKNREYIFEFDESVELKEQKLLEETRAILFNLFRDYLCSSVQKEKIIQMQIEERNKLNEIKKSKYNDNDIFKKHVDKEVIDNKRDSIQENTAIAEIKKESFIVKIINKIKKIFFKNSI